jgi:hypothetical protein
MIRRTIADITILSSLATMLEAFFCTAWREGDAQHLTDIQNLLIDYLKIRMSVYLDTLDTGNEHLQTEVIEQPIW